MATLVAIFSIEVARARFTPLLGLSWGWQGAALARGRQGALDDNRARPRARTRSNFHASPCAYPKPVYMYMPLKRSKSPVAPFFLIWLPTPCSKKIPPL